MNEAVSQEKSRREGLKTAADRDFDAIRRARFFFY
jgi:hypothetical protein